MTEEDLPSERLASVFANFVRQVASAVSHDPSPLLNKITEHLNTDPAELPQPGWQAMPTGFPAKVLIRKDR